MMRGVFTVNGSLIHDESEQHHGLLAVRQYWKRPSQDALSKVWQNQVWLLWSNSRLAQHCVRVFNGRNPFGMVGYSRLYITAEIAGVFKVYGIDERTLANDLKE